MQLVWSASTMGFVHIERGCEEFWCDNLAASNCVEIFVLADKFGFIELRRKSLAYICVLFKFVPEDDLKCLQFSNFPELLKCNEIHASEDSIFQRLVKNGLRPKNNIDRSMRQICSNRFKSKNFRSRYGGGHRRSSIIIFKC